jgi:hypothetical protein
MALGSLPTVHDSRAHGGKDAAGRERDDSQVTVRLEPRFVIARPARFGGERIDLAYGQICWTTPTLGGPSGLRRRTRRAARPGRSAQLAHA